MDKKKVYVKVIVVVLAAVMGFTAFKYCKHIGEVAAAYREAERFIDNNDYEGALVKLETIEADDYHDTKALIELCEAHIAYEDGNVKSAHWTMDSLNYTYQREEQKRKIEAFGAEVEEAYYVYLKEEGIKEQKAYEEKVRNGVPFVGMDESNIRSTSLGSPSLEIRHNKEWIDGKQYTANLYDFKDGRNTIFTARCLQGKVTEVWDERDNPEEPYQPSYSGSDKIDKEDAYDVYEYDDPEDFYYDNYDDFDGYEDAEDYWDDAWD